ncbi:SprT family zinc-dependent metalloprotease [Ningiella sp. W23]|uniref:SprT family zinc-dependent metalloprotease n=1 Tax=Ningiella sp. W23 TaxID=3023715 RepID=UPI0037569F0E
MTQPLLSLQAIAQKSLLLWMSKLNTTDLSLKSAPEILMNQRGRIAGAALLGKNQIKLNAKLFQQNTEYFKEQVIPHELAHLAVYEHFGRVRPHGKQWRFVMQDLFGLKADVKHQLDLNKAGIKQFSYKCACGTVELSTVRHNRVVRGKQQYRCRTCMQTLRFVAN